MATDDSLIKNGRDEKRNRGITRIGGYPDVVARNNGAPLPDSWEAFFLPQDDHLSASPPGSCLLRFDLKLTSPFYSRDDRVFYPIENVLRREWVFDAPYLSAAGIKGLVRWAWRMCWRDAKKDEEWLVFGPRQMAFNEEEAFQGLLYTYPLFWKGKVGFDVINPHDRLSGTGTRPIKYEVVKKGGTGSLFLLLINRVEKYETISNALDLLEPPLKLLVEHSGLSAKWSIGWGDVEITGCKGVLNVPAGYESLSEPPASEADPWDGLTDEDGELRPLDDTQFFTTAKFAELLNKSKSWVKKKEKKEKKKTMVLEMWEEKKLEAESAEDVPQKRSTVLTLKERVIVDLTKKLQDNLLKLNGN